MSKLLNVIDPKGQPRLVSARLAEVGKYFQKGWKLAEGETDTRDTISAPEPLPEVKKFIEEKKCCADKAAECCKPAEVSEPEQDISVPEIITSDDPIIKEVTMPDENKRKIVIEKQDLPERQKRTRITAKKKGRGKK